MNIQNKDTEVNAGKISEIEISRMLPADIPAVEVIERQTFSQPWSRDGFLSSLSQECSLYLKAILSGSGEIVGYCGLLQSFEEAEIVNVAVRSDFRNMGIGNVMLHELIELGGARGIKRFILEVRKSNQAARHLYGKLGFVTEGVRRNFYEEPREDAIIMCKLC